VLLRERFRGDEGRLQKRTLANLSRLPGRGDRRLRAILKGAIVIGTDPASLRIERALPHGHLAATLGWFARSRWTG
jgi:hypothetical protein